MSEFIYILENVSLPRVIKIGRTEREVAQRVKELSAATGVPTEFTVFRQYAVENSIAAERQIHERLDEYRVSDNREFFRLSAEDAASILEEMLGKDSRRFPDHDRENERNHLVAGHRRGHARDGQIGPSHQSAAQVCA